MKHLKQIKYNVNNYLFIACLLFFGMGTAISANAQTASLEGTFDVYQVNIKKTVNGVASEKTYSVGEPFESFMSCPQKITFKSDNKVVFEYSTQEAIECKYSIENDNKIKIMSDVAIFEYGYTIIQADNILLNHSIDYVYNHVNGPTDEITEEYTFFIQLKVEN
jgi:hypothetical protein